MYHSCVCCVCVFVYSYARDQPSLKSPVGDLEGVMFSLVYSVCVCLCQYVCVFVCVLCVFVYRMCVYHSCGWRATALCDEQYDERYNDNYDRNGTNTLCGLSTSVVLYQGCV